MKLIGLLLLGDLKSVRFWLKKNTISRISVMIGFITVCLLTSLFIFFISRGFFIYLKQFGQFGELTVEYLVSATIVVTCWFALITSLISIYGFLVQPTKETDFLLTQPVSPAVIPILYFIRTTVINVFLFLVIFLPVVIGYQQVFFAQFSFALFGRFVTIVLLLVLILNSVATWIVYHTADWWRRPGPLSGLIMLAVFFGGLFGLLKIIFPAQINLLLEAEIDQFFMIYSRLPLTQSWLPINWVTSSILTGWSINSLFFILLATIVTIISLRLQIVNFLIVYQRLHPKAHRMFAKQPLSRLFWDHPLMYKDYLSIVREPAEIGYLFFLLGVGFFFFLLLTVNVSFNSQFAYNWQSQLIIFSFVWLLFFVTAFSLRLIYPLMAREGVGRWYIFSLPVGRERILYEKIKFSCIIILPFILFSLLLWWIFPIIYFKWLLILISIISVITIALINVLMGAVAPEFDQGDSAEKVSTSGMGVLTLLLSFIYTSATSCLIWLRLELAISSFALFIWFINLTTIVLVASYLLAIKRVNQYQL